MNVKLITMSTLSSMVILACSVDQPMDVSQTKQQTLIQPQPLLSMDMQKPVPRTASKLKIESSSMMVAEQLSKPSIRYERPPITPPMPSPLLIDDNNQFETIKSNVITRVSQQPVSTFSIDVDTGSYAIVRQYLNRGQLPPSDAVRIEEMVNYFDYRYQKPSRGDAPFSVSTQVTKTPWNDTTHLLQIGLQGYLPQQKRRSANLVFLLDVSGSMNAPDKLPLLKNAFTLLSKQLTQDDKISIVVYAGASGVVLKPTAGSQKSDIIQAINALRSGGSTNGASGIKLAYQLAEESFIKEGINRVILATDGDFNVGTVNHNALLDLIKREKQKGIALTTLGFGHGNYNDRLMEQLADSGDGNYAYIDNLSEAQKVLVGQLSATLETIAKDVKIQVEWNPEQVANYRLIGYENRLLNREDFNNDKVDAGEIGAGHTVTALYEITLKKDLNKQQEPLRYQAIQPKTKPNLSNELAFVKLRYKSAKQLSSAPSLLIKHPVTADSLQQKNDKNELLFAASVAAFGQKLRHGTQLNDFNYSDILSLARRHKGNDPHGYRGEFLKLVELAKSLDNTPYDKPRT